MLNGFWKLTWVEIKVFLREPMGVLSTVGIPVIMFLLLGRVLAGRPPGTEVMGLTLSSTLPIFAAIFISLGAVLSLIAIISIYREGGILKRLRATPLRPITILGAHVVVKLMFTAVSMMLLVLAGKRFFPGSLDIGLLGLTLALMISTLSILSVGFVIASIVPTARFAQPIGSALLYPMVAISGLFFPLELLPAGWRIFANLLPVTHAVSLLQGVWDGVGWVESLPAVGALALIFVVCTAVASRIFRWE